MNGVCSAMWLSLEDLLREQPPNDSILSAWLIRHAAWCLTRFQGKTEDLRLCVFWESVHEPSIAIRRKRDVQVKYTSVPTGNLDQRWGHGIWVGKAPLTDEHIILTENGVQKARSLHRVPPEERFVISELKKVRGLLGTIGKGIWPMREQILSKRQLDRTLSLPPSPKNQHRRHRAGASVFIIRTCCADANAKPSERADGSPMELGPQAQRTQRSAAKRDSNK